MKYILTAIMAVIVLSGCAADLVDQNPTYAKVPAQEITTKDGTYLVKVADGKALIRPTVATAFGTMPILPHYRDAVRVALKKTGRDCHLTEGYPNGSFFEFSYKCK